VIRSGLITDVELLAPLSASERSEVLAAAVTRNFRRGETVMREGEPGESLHLVRSGTLAVRVSTPAGAADERGGAGEGAGGQVEGADVGEDQDAGVGGEDERPFVTEQGIAADGHRGDGEEKRSLQGAEFRVEGWVQRSRARSAAPTSPESLPSCAGTTSASGRRPRPVSSSS